MISHDEYISEHLKLAELKWEEQELGEVIITKTQERRAKHTAVQMQKDVVDAL